MTIPAAALTAIDQGLALLPAVMDTEPASVIYVGTTGNVAIKPADGGAAVTFVGVPAGATLPALAMQVLSTGTTASNIVRVS